MKWMAGLLIIVSGIWLVACGKADTSADVLEKPGYIERLANFEGRPRNANAIVMLGDSITDLGYWSESFPGLPILNRGISGDTTVGVAARLDEVIARAPKAVFLMIGTNDLAFGATPSEAHDRLRTILARFQSEIPMARIYLQSVLPTRSEARNTDIETYNRLAEASARDFDATWLNLAPKFRDGDGLLAQALTFDGLHLTSAGYEIWADQIRPMMEDRQPR